MGKNPKFLAQNSTDSSSSIYPSLKIKNLHLKIDNNNGLGEYGKNKALSSSRTELRLGFHFLKPLIHYGHFSLVVPYHFQMNSSAGSGGESFFYKTKYKLKTNRLFTLALFTLYAIMGINMAIRVIHFHFNITYSLLVNTIKRITYGVYFINLVIAFLSLQTRKRNWVRIFKQMDVIQDKLERHGVNMPSLNRLRCYVAAILLICLAMGIIHGGVFFVANCHNSTGLEWYQHYANNLINILTFCFYGGGDHTQLPVPLLYTLGVIGIAVEFFSWNMWYFIDAMRVISALTVLITYSVLNKALSRGKLGVENLSDIMEIHFQGTKLLNLWNQLLSPITFISTTFNILHVCFWTNYSLISFQFQLSHIVGILTVLRMIFVFFIVADVNTKAHKISSWLENNFAELGQSSKKIDGTKLTLFTSLIYNNREAIGFKGFNFFTITPQLNVAICGLVMTYTVVVNQVATGEYSARHLQELMNNNNATSTTVAADAIVATTTLSTMIMRNFTQA